MGIIEIPVVPRKFMVLTVAIVIVLLRPGYIVTPVQHGNPAITPVVPLPFGDTFALQQPVVTSVSPTCVNAGNNFTINGSGLYPSLVSKVLIDSSLANAYTTRSDTQIDVIAPEQSGEALPVVVQTGEGISNSNVTIEISVIDLCSVGAR